MTGHSQENIIGLIGRTEDNGYVPPPNNPPTWTGTPAPSWLAGTGGTVDLDSYTFDQEGDTLSYTLNGASTALPTGVTISGTNLVGTSSVVTGTTTGILIDCYDGIETVTSNSFSIVVADPAAQGIIIWNGNVDNGSFDEWHYNSSTASVQFPLVPVYGKPPDYGSSGTGAGSANQTQVGNGALLDIVNTGGSGGYPAGPTRGSAHAIRFTVKNSANGTEPTDCDPATDCRWRRSMLAHTQFTVDPTSVTPKVALLPNNGPQRWVSMSIYLDDNFPLVRDNTGVSDFCNLHGIKAGYTVGAGPYSAPINGWFGIFVGDNGWVIRDTWFGRTMSGGTNPPTVGNVDYRYQSSYSGNGAHFGSENWAAGASAHFVTGGQTMLSNVVRGAWTDFIYTYVTDTVNDGSTGANQGWLDVYMRNEGSTWKKILEIRPIDVSNGLNYMKGIGCDGAYYTNFDIAIYTNKGRTWNAPNNAIAYFDNVKIGDEDCTFSQMTHDGSTYTP